MLQHQPAPVAAAERLCPGDLQRRRINIVYATGRIYGSVRVLIDGSEVGVIDQYSLIDRSQRVWTSPVLAAGVHTVHIFHLSGGVVNVDSIQIAAEPDTTAPAAIAGLAAGPGAARPRST